jgi:uncharacterized membrane protein
MENTDTQSEAKTYGIIAYITLIGLIIAFILNSEKQYAFTKYHIRQMLGIVIGGIVASLLSLIPFLGWLISLAYLILAVIMWIVGLMHAINGQMKPVPVLGEKFEEWFKGL